MARQTPYSWILLVALAGALLPPAGALGQQWRAPSSPSAILGEPVSPWRADPTEPPVPLIDLDEQMPDGVDSSLAWDGDYRQATGIILLPDGTIYRPYLAGPKESRLSGTMIRIEDDSWFLDGTLGARVGVVRIGTVDPVRPRGFQMDVEGSGQVRLDLEEEVDVRSTDYRAGVPLTWGDQRSQWKFAYYHISSHLGDEFLLKNPDFPVFFQVRDVLVLGYSHYLADWLRVYAEAGWAFKSHASEPWEFQFGVDCAPRGSTGLRGAPFFAVNGMLREERDFGGLLTVQTGWAWRSHMSARLMRVGLQYSNGASSQYAFLPYHEQQIGAGLWYDF